MSRRAGIRTIAWVLCIALLALRVGGAHAHLHLHLDGAEPDHGVHVHTVTQAHQEPIEENWPHFELELGSNAELISKKPAGSFDFIAPLVVLVLLLIVGLGSPFVPRRRPAPIRVLSVFAMRPLLRAPPV